MNRAVSLFWQRLKSRSIKQWLKFIFVLGILGAFAYNFAHEALYRWYLVPINSQLELTLHWPNLRPASLTLDLDKVTLDKEVLPYTQNGWRNSYKQINFTFFVDPNKPDAWFPHLPDSDAEGTYIKAEVKAFNKIFGASNVYNHFARTSRPRRADMYGLQVYYATPYAGDPVTNVPPSDIGPLYMYHLGQAPEQKVVLIICTGLKAHDRCRIIRDLSGEHGFTVKVNVRHLPYWETLLASVQFYLNQNMTLPPHLSQGAMDNQPIAGNRQ